MIDTEIWSRWKGLAKTIMAIPKFKRVWEKTKDVHANEFRNLLIHSIVSPDRFDTQYSNQSVSQCNNHITCYFISGSCLGLSNDSI